MTGGNGTDGKEIADAVILVHPEYKVQERDGSYILSLAALTKTCRETGTPLIAIPENCKRMPGLIGELAERWIMLTSEAYYDPELALQVAADETDLPIGKLRLFYGGSYFHGCVASFGMRTCVEYDGPALFGITRMTEDEKIPPELAKKGTVCKEISKFI